MHTPCEAGSEVTHGDGKGVITANIVTSFFSLSLYGFLNLQIAIKNRLPSLCEGEEMVNAGGLMSYSASESDQFRRAASYMDKILKRWAAR